MTLSEGKNKFINEWGMLSMNWGINRTMGTIHAILLISSEEMSADQVMEQLQISRGNANMNMRLLVDWGLVYKVLKTGHRKEYFRAEKDMWKVLQCIIEHRKKKELDPLNKLLVQLEAVEPNCIKSDEFCKIVRDLRQFSSKAETTFGHILNSEKNWFTSSVFKMIR